MGINPRLVVGEATACDSSITWQAEEESHGLLAAAAGVAQKQLSVDGGPVEFVAPHILYLQGVWITTCLVAALIERQGSGLGQVVTVSGANAAMLLGAMYIAGDPSVPNTPGSLRPNSLQPTYNLYKAGDGAWFVLGALPQTNLPSRLIDALGVDRVMKEGHIDRSDRIFLAENRENLRGALESIFLTRSRADWMTFLDGLGIPCGLVSDRDDWLNHPHLAATGLRLEIEDTDRGRVVMPGILIDMDKSPAHIVAAAPRLGEHDDLFRSDGIASHPARGESLRTSTRGRIQSAPASGPLAGLRVLNAGAFIAGPVVGHLLAELGADVIKVEPPQGDPFRVTGLAYNRGMKSLSLDLKQAKAQDLLHLLVAQSDVVIENSRAGVSSRLKLDYPSLATSKPDVVGVSISAFGATGPLVEKAGFDPILAGYSGIIAAQGGELPLLTTLPFVDTTTGALGSLAACMGVFCRLRHNYGQHVCTSLAAGATMSELGELVRFHGCPSPIIGGINYRGREAWDRIYKVKDGWLRVRSPETEVGGEERLRRVLSGVARVDGRDASPDSSDAPAEFDVILAQMTVEEALQVFDSGGLAAAAVRTEGELRRDERLRSDGLTETHARRDGRAYVTAGRLATFSRTQRKGALVAPGVGEHTRSILHGVGVSSAELAELVAGQIAAEGPAMDPEFL
jgi:crotonobetainyl-CoA:carnitine CoA-transferase CaiB-like acyl-CoA transferase